MTTDAQLPPPDMVRGTKLLPYEERWFSTKTMADALGYTDNQANFYRESTVRAAIEAYRTSRQGEAAAWLNFKCIVKDGELVGHEPPELNFKRLSYGYDWSKSVALVPADATQAERAAMYQQLRRGLHWSVVDGSGEHLRGEHLDKAIRTAIAKEQKP